MNTTQSAGGLNKRFERDQMIGLLTAALETRSFRFGRQAVLAWLAIYPGDLQMTLFQARLILAEGKISQGLPILERLMRIDPEYGDAYRTMAHYTFGTDLPRYEAAITNLAALKEGRPGGPAVKEWGQALREVRVQMDRDHFGDAEEALLPVLARQDVPVIAEIYHLKLIKHSGDVQMLRQKADSYRARHSECLQFSLYMADALMSLGKESEAVNLLHRSMAMDGIGQVAVRMWGFDHPYRNLWPENLSISQDLAIPVDVAVRMGVNLMLPSGGAFGGEMTGESASLLPADFAAEPLAISGGEAAHVMAEPTASQPNEPEGQTDTGERNDKQEKDLPVRPTHPIDPKFEELARKLKRPAIGRADGRYPVYVIFSTRKGLEEQYGAQTTQILDTEMHRLGDAIRRRTGWEMLVFYPDDPKSTSAMGLEPLTSRDPWKLKLAVADLDKVLAKKGLMIGMMLIVGGPQIVPFHDLPNPTDDFDTTVSSDNPYATLDSNYFVPEWSIGRLPGSAGSDAALLLEQLRYLIAYHNRRSGEQAGRGWLALVGDWLRSLARFLAFGKEKPNFGYTAAIWRRSSVAVFRPVGNPSNLMVCPPQVSGSLPVDRLLAPSLAYYNLHGVADGGEWYGQRDPTEPGTGPDYPVALSPKELHRNGHAPRMIFSEACYGGHITNKTEEDALSLKFLSLGTLAMVGSTSISYGSISTPLIAADLLGNIFWQNVRGGRTVGEALMIAKVELVREMVNRQGYLDAEDQKTLLSFILYGDPMVSLDTAGKVSKSRLRFKRSGMVKTIEERPVQKDAITPVSEKVLEEVRLTVAGCLPGIETAEISIHEELGSAVSTAKVGKQGKLVAVSDSRYVVTLSKQVPNAKYVHRHYVRATVENGKVVKLAISR